MTEDVKTKDAAKTAQHESISLAAEDLTRSVTELVGAVFNVGAAMAKTVAQATAGDRPLTDPKSPQGPLNLIIHYGLTAASNIVRTVASSDPITSAGATARPPAATGPSVIAGSTLRMPLSIENTGASPMESLEFHCSKIEVLQAADGQRLGVSNVRISPAKLSIAPRDFEKLTVFVDTTAMSAPGTYRAVIGAGTFETGVEFRVLSTPSGKDGARRA